MMPDKCEKAPHGNPWVGYLHAEDDDAPYDVDGLAYCGRCHVALAAHLTPETRRMARGFFVNAESDSTKVADNDGCAMTVRELIDRLSKCDGGMTVVVNTATNLDGYDIAITGIEVGDVVVICAPADNPEDG